MIVLVNAPYSISNFFIVLFIKTYNQFHNILRLFDEYFESFHHKWNEAQLLFINMVYTSSLKILGN